LLLSSLKPLRAQNPAAHHSFDDTPQTNAYEISKLRIRDNTFGSGSHLKTRKLGITQKLPVSNETLAAPFQ
jgi:hypothetical protein